MLMKILFELLVISLASASAIPHGRLSRQSTPTFDTTSEAGRETILQIYQSQVVSPEPTNRSFIKSCFAMCSYCEREGALEIIGHPEQRVIIDMQTGKVEVASEAFRTCRTSCFLRREAQFMNLGYDFTETCYKCFKNQSYC